MTNLSNSILGKTPEEALKTPISKPGSGYSISQDILSPDPTPQFKLAIDQGSRRNREQSSRIIKASQKTGLPEDHIERNLDEAERNARLSEIDIDRMSKSAPKVAEWMAKSPNHASAGYNDLTSLNYLELQLRNIKNKFVEGRRTVELADIGESAFLGSVTPEQRKRQAEIEAELSKQEDLGIDGFFEGIPGAVSNQLPILAKTIGGQIQGAAVGGATGAAIGAGTALVAGQIGPQVVAPEEIVTVPSAALAVGSRGAIAGWRYGAAVQAARLEASLAYLDYEKITDENGKKIERSTAIGAAAMVGVINGALEFVGFEALTKAVPGLRNLQRKGIRQALKNPVVRSALTTYAKNIGEAVTTEGLTEFMQEIVTQSGGEISKMVADGESVSLNDFLGRVFSDDNIAQALQAGKAGAQAGGGISIGAGAVSTTIDIRKAKQAQQQAEQIKKTGDVVESMKLTETNPESVEQIVENITEGGEMYIPSDSFQTYWQQQGVDPRQVISDVLGDTEQYDKAIESGQDIVIPASKYYTSKQLGGGEHKVFFANEVRTDPLELNAREWNEEVQRLDEQEQLNQDENTVNDIVVDETVKNVRQNIKDQLTESGFDNRTADSYAQLFESTFASLSERTGTDPMELFERFKPEINKLDNEQTKTFLQRVSEGVKRVFQKENKIADASKKITETKEFKSWFGDSKVVDDSGKPLVMYHGTPDASFESFKKDQFFTSDKKYASRFKSSSTSSSSFYGVRDNNPDVFEVFIKSDNPFDTRRKDHEKILKERFSGVFGEGVLTENSLPDWVEGRDIAEFLRNEIPEKGFDSVIVDEGKDSSGKRPPAYIVFSPNQIKSVNNRGTFNPNDPRILFQDENQVTRGAFRFGNGTFNISLLEDANLSTFLHETGHFYLEVMNQLSLEPNNDQIKNDIKTITDWLGVESFDQIKTEHHEKFARGFEAYLMEGKAPSTALRRIFARFKVWLTQIYGTLTNLNVELTDEVRGVFDRLVATDQQIAEVEGELNIAPLFDDTTILGSKATNYEQAILDYRNTVSEQATDKLMKEYQREQKKWYKDELNSIRSNVEQELNKSRTYLAWFALRKGTLPDGTGYAADTLPPKLDRKAVEKIIGKDRTRNLPRGIFAKDGAHPSILADLFQFRSDVEMLEALETAENPRDYVERVANERMKERYPNLETQEQQFREEILKDVHNEKRAEVLRFELQWLADEAPKVLKEAIRRVTRRVPSNKDVRVYARNTISKQTVSKIRPDVYLRAEKNAARDAGRALAKGDLDAAFEQKRIELINHELYKEAVAAKEKVQKSLQDFRKISRADKALAKARDMDLVNAARAILADYGIGYEQATPESFLENIRNYDPETYESVYPLVRVSIENSADYKSISYGDFQSLNDTVQALWELSRSSRQIEIDGQKLDRDEVVDGLVEKLKDMMPVAKKESYKKKKWYSKALLTAKAYTRRLESWADLMDDGDINGKFTKTIVTPVVEATERYRDARTEKLKELYEIVKKVESSLDTEQIQAPELASNLKPEWESGFTFESKADLLMAMLHTGNNSNLFKLIVGYKWGQLDENGILDRSRWDSFVERMENEGILTKKDYDFLQAIWDFNELMKPEAQKAHRKIYGYYFSEITANEFENRFGRFRGGYMPAKIDPENSVEQVFRDSKNELFDTQDLFTFPNTGSKWAQKRVENYAEPLDLNFRNIIAHTDSVLKFVHINPVVKDVGKILLNRRFKKAVHDFDSELMKGMFVPWLKRVASQRSDTSDSNNVFVRGARSLRRNISMNYMFMNVTNAMMQYTGLFLSNLKVPSKYLVRGASQMIKQQFSQQTLRDEISEKSLFMKNRVTTSAIEVQKSIDDIILNPNAYQKGKSWLNQHAYFLQTIAQNHIDTITWIGAYNYSIENNMSEKDAVRSADSAVRQTQGSFNPEDLSTVETGNIFMRVTLMFYNYFNMKMNLVATEGGKIINKKGFIKGSPQLTLLFIQAFALPIATLIAIKMLANGVFDEDDDGDILDDFGSNFIFTTMEDVTAFIPILGPVVQGFINRFDDKFYNDRLTTPFTSLGESAWSFGKEFVDLLTPGEDVNKKRLIKDGSIFIGGMTGLPLYPGGRATGYLIDVNEGKAEPSGPIDFTRGLITGRRGN